MSDLPERNPLLPDRAGPIERAVSKTEGRLDDVSYAQVRRVRSVADAQGAELDHLAAERSVDVYDRDWPEEIRRAVVAGWPHVQALKGTPLAIEAALSAMRVTAELTEWWEASPPGIPYTFEALALVGVRLYPGAPVLNERTLAAVFATVMRTKAHSRPFGLRVGVRLDTRLGLAPLATGVSRIASVAAAVLPIPPAGSALGLAPVAAGVSRIASSAAAILPMPALAAGLGVAPAAAARVRVAFSASAA